jgi:hypothetical protein
MGADFVLEMATTQELHPSVTTSLVKRCSPDGSSLTIEEGVSIPIRAQIKDLYDMPSGGTPIRANQPDYVKRSERFRYLDKMTMTKFWVKVHHADTSDEDFCVLFMLGLQNMFLSPSALSRTGRVDTRFLECLVDHTKIKDLDWCTFIADCLIEGICKYKAEGDYVEGCLHALHVSSKVMYLLL